MTFAVAVIGRPNVGKSTLLNTLVGKAKAKVGNEPAVTKGQQRIRLEDGLYLYDTPTPTLSYDTPLYPNPNQIRPCKRTRPDENHPGQFWDRLGPKYIPNDPK